MGDALRKIREIEWCGWIVDEEVDVIVSVRTTVARGKPGENVVVERGEVGTETTTDRSCAGVSASSSSATVERKGKMRMA